MTRVQGGDGSFVSAFAPLRMTDCSPEGIGRTDPSTPFGCSEWQRRTPKRQGQCRHTLALVISPLAGLCRRGDFQGGTACKKSHLEWASFGTFLAHQEKYEKISPGWRSEERILRLRFRSAQDDIGKLRRGHNPALHGEVGGWGGFVDTLESVSPPGLTLFPCLFYGPWI